jgi:XTP/dITP diphosphohydrolase
VRELLIATRNEKKKKELKILLNGIDVRILTLRNFNGLPPILEDGKNFKENAIKKAVTSARLTGKFTLADDSGLEVSALGNKPGIYSARFAGRYANDSKNNLKLLKLLKGVPLKKRRARFVCNIAIADKTGLIAATQGSCGGLIGFEIKGTHGFGYDPLFIIPKYNKTFAQLGPDIKNRMSHRFKALRRAKKIILRYFQRTP